MGGTGHQEQLWDRGVTGAQLSQCNWGEWDPGAEAARSAAAGGTRTVHTEIRSHLSRSSYIYNIYFPTSGSTLRSARGDQDAATGAVFMQALRV